MIWVAHPLKFCIFKNVTTCDRWYYYRRVISWVILTISIKSGFDYFVHNLNIGLYTDLAPNQHGAKDDLEAVEEVVTDDDDGGAPTGPPLARADGLDAGGRHWQWRVEACT